MRRAHQGQFNGYGEVKIQYFTWRKFENAHDDSRFNNNLNEHWSVLEMECHEHRPDTRDFLHIEPMNDGSFNRLAPGK